MGRRRRASEAPPQDRWILSYADFITLLFAFFTTLYAMSVTDVRKAEALAESIRASFGDSAIHAGATTPGVFTEGGESPTASPAQQDLEDRRRLDGLGDRARDLASGLPEPAGVRVRHSEEGLVISLADSFFFDTGGARIRTRSLEALREVAKLLAPLPNHVRVEGHTDDEPVKGRVFRSNWHLSALRAVEVLRVFEQLGIQGYRLSASGFADQRPLVSNATLAGRRMNRRVDIVVLHARADGRDV